MDNQDIIRIDGIKWWITQSSNGARLPIPLCPEHNLRMTAVPPKVYNRVSRMYFDGSYTKGMAVKCAEGPHTIDLLREYNEEVQYVINRMDAKVFKGMKVLNLDDEAVPVAKAKAASKDNKYFVTAQLMESKRGIQAVIYAGEKGKGEKTQIFVEPAAKRLTFDHKDIHPTDIFLRVDATFDDGSRHSIEKG